MCAWLKALILSPLCLCDAISKIILILRIHFLKFFSPRFLSFIGDWDLLGCSLKWFQTEGFHDLFPPEAQVVPWVSPPNSHFSWGEWGWTYAKTNLQEIIDLSAKSGVACEMSQNKIWRVRRCSWKLQPEDQLCHDVTNHFVISICRGDFSSLACEIWPFVALWCLVIPAPCAQLVSLSALRVVSSTRRNPWEATKNRCLVFQFASLKLKFRRHSDFGNLWDICYY